MGIHTREEFLEFPVSLISLPHFLSKTEALHFYIYTLGSMVCKRYNDSHFSYDSHFSHGQHQLSYLCFEMSKIAAVQKFSLTK